MAMSLDLLVGYTGLSSLGHAAYFAVAGSTVGVLSTRFGLGFWPTAALAVLAAVATAALFGLLAIRAAGAYFLIITLALGQIIWGLAYRWISITGGDNGINVKTRPAPFGVDLGAADGFYYTALVIFLIAVVVVAIFVRSPFGAALRGTRDQPRRMNALGYHVWAIRFWACVLSGLLTAVAGILFVYYTQFISPQSTSL